MFSPGAVIRASFCTHPPYFVGTPPPVGGLPPRWTGPPLRSVALSAAGGVTTDSVGVLAVSPLKRSPSFSRTATGASKSPVFTMKTSHAAKRQGDFFAEARASPTPHTYVEHPRSRRPDPACRRFVQALAALKRLVNGYSVSPAKLIVWTTTTRVWTWTSSCSDPILSVSVSSSARTRTTRSD